jgi:hypothetical protein
MTHGIFVPINIVGGLKPTMTEARCCGGLKPTLRRRPQFWRYDSQP